MSDELRSYVVNDEVIDKLKKFKGHIVDSFKRQSELEEELQIEKDFRKDEIEIITSSTGIPKKDIQKYVKCLQDVSKVEEMQEIVENFELLQSKLK